MPKMPGDRHMKGGQWFRRASRPLAEDAPTVARSNRRLLHGAVGLRMALEPVRRLTACCLAKTSRSCICPITSTSCCVSLTIGMHWRFPHHLAYARGWRGANFDHFTAAVSPVVEIFSEHGCSETITAPVGDFIRHSMGGRVTENTVDRQLQPWIALRLYRFDRRSPWFSGRIR